MANDETSSPLQVLLGQLGLTDFESNFAAAGFVALEDLTENVERINPRNLRFLVPSQRRQVWEAIVEITQGREQDKGAPNDRDVGPCRLSNPRGASLDCPSSTVRPHVKETGFGSAAAASATVSSAIALRIRHEAAAFAQNTRNSLDFSPLVKLCLEARATTVSRMATAPPVERRAAELLGSLRAV